MSDFEILQQLCETADELSKKYISSSSPDFKAWKTRADRLLIRRFGKDSYEFKSFNKISYSLSFFTSGTPDSAFVEACADGLRSAKAVLETYLDEFSDEGETGSTANVGDYSKVFIVHGHNGELRERVARIIERQGLTAVVLNEQSNQGKTIIEKLEIEGDAAGAVCLLRRTTKEEPRQNSRKSPGLDKMLYLKPDTLLVGLAGKTLQFLLTKVSRFPPIYRASFIPEQTVGSSAS